MRPVRRVTLGLVVSMTTWCGSAQIPEAPRPALDGQLTNDFTVSGSTVAVPHLDSQPESSSAVSNSLMEPTGIDAPRKADTRFYTWNAIHLGMAVFDIEMTQHCIASHHCREANPVLPSSRAGQLTINLAIVAYTTGMSYWLKKHRSGAWWAVPAAGAAVHGVGVASGFEHR